MESQLLMTQAQMPHVIWCLQVPQQAQLPHRMLVLQNYNLTQAQALLPPIS
jgi:hypothetical protein